MVSFTFHQVSITHSQREDGSISSEAAYRALLLHKKQIVPQRIIEMNQVHGNHIEYLSSDQTYPSRIGETDGLIATAKDTALLIKTADCLPMVITSDTKPVVAALHAGWRGLVTHIPAQAVIQLTQRFGLVPKQLFAYIGPSIHQCCYIFPNRPTQATDSHWQPFLKKKADGWHVDLPGFARASLLRLGIPSHHIKISNQCTCHQSDTYFSYFRHQKDQSRMGLCATVVQLI